MIRLAAAFLLPLLAANPRPNEKTVPIAAHWHAGLDSLLRPFHWLPLSWPRLDPHVYVRLRVASPRAGARFWINSVPVSPIAGSAGDFEITNPPRSGAHMWISVIAAEPPGSATLIISPRVFLSELRLQACPGSIRAAVWIRNTLENTVNISLRAELLTGASGAATIPPHSAQPVNLELRDTRLSSGTHWKMNFVLDKYEEAVEPAYAVTEVVTFSVAEAGTAGCR
ncbi:MAG: hypothetical protein FJW20_14415 [Acidimicrobiia bacterium]|nr:hypothetical protein [Acidimicrobiia bacterium]